MLHLLQIVRLTVRVATELPKKRLATAAKGGWISIMFRMPKPSGSICWKICPIVIAGFSCRESTSKDVVYRSLATILHIFIRPSGGGGGGAGRGTRQYIRRRSVAWCVRQVVLGSACRWNEGFQKSGRKRVELLLERRENQIKSNEVRSSVIHFAAKSREKGRHT